MEETEGERFMKARTWTVSSLALAMLGGGLASVSSSQQPAPQPTALSEADMAIGATTFDNKCKGCHDPAAERAPSREALAQRSPEQVVTALTTGSMQAMASGLTPDMIRAVASYVTGKPFSEAG